MDTNALFLPFTHGVDLASEVQRLVGSATMRVPDSVLGELTRLKARGTAGAPAALELARRFPSVPTAQLGDEAVLSLAVAGEAWVVTADAALRRVLVDRGVSVLYPRDRNRLDLEPGRPRESTGRRRNAPSGKG